MFVLKRVLVTAAIVLLLVAALEQGPRMPELVVVGALWVGRVALVAASGWVILASRWRDAPTRGLGHGVELNRPGVDADEL
jgi:hypothetical protein